MINLNNNTSPEQSLCFVWNYSISLKIPAEILMKKVKKKTYLTLILDKNYTEIYLTVLVVKKTILQKYTALARRRKHCRV